MSQSIYIQYHYTYIITNTNTQMKYIGVRSCNFLPENDSDYMGSSKALDESMNETPESFTKTIIGTFPTRENANADEQWLHEMYDVARNPEFYNLMNAPLGFDNTGKHHTPEIRKKLSLSHKGNTHTEESKKKISLSKIGKNNPMYGKPVSTEHRSKISAALKGEKNGMYGRKHTEETKKKISENRSSISGKNNPMYGKTHSDASRKKMSESLRGKKKPPFTEEHRRNLSLALKKKKLSIS
jgi:group I intron endonuclease